MGFFFLKPVPPRRRRRFEEGSKERDKVHSTARAVKESKKKFKERLAIVMAWDELSVSEVGGDVHVLALLGAGECSAVRQLVSALI